MLAEVAEDLVQTLLGGTGLGSHPGRTPEQPLPGEPKRRVVPGGRPIEVAPLNLGQPVFPAPLRGPGV
jgi:hypothetical protein